MAGVLTVNPADPSLPGRPASPCWPYNDKREEEIVSVTSCENKTSRTSVFTITQ